MLHHVVKSKLSIFVQMDKSTASECKSDFLGRSSTDLDHSLEQVSQDAAHLLFTHICDNWNWGKIDCSQLLFVYVLKW